MLTFSSVFASSDKDARTLKFDASQRRESLLPMAGADERVVLACPVCREAINSFETARTNGGCRENNIEHMPVAAVRPNGVGKQKAVRTSSVADSFF